MLEVDLIPSEIERRAYASARRDRENDEQPHTSRSDMR